MSQECLICDAPLKYLQTDVVMECSICHEKENSKTMCENGHYICSNCHTGKSNSIIRICLRTYSTNPVEIIQNLMSQSFCHMHGPEHHIMVGSALLTAYRNAGGKIDLENALIEMSNRAKQVPGGSCGYWGACGAGISTGMFISIITKSTPLKVDEFSLSHKMTVKSLTLIGENGGPRCCKRDSYLSILAAIDFVEENFNIKMTSHEIKCKHSNQNNQCIKTRCPFY